MIYADTDFFLALAKKEPARIKVIKNEQGIGQTQDKIRRILDRLCLLRM